MAATVVGTDGSEQAASALDWAIDHGAGKAIVLVRVVDSTIGGADYVVTEGSLGAAQDGLDREADRVRSAHPGLDVSTQLVHGDPITELARFSTAESLLVVGTQKRTGSRFRYSWSVGARLASTANGPVAIIPHDTARVGRGIVAGVDGSEPSAAALLFAAAEAAREGAPLTAIHAWQDPATERAHRALLDGAVSGLSGGFPRVEVTPRLVQGTPAWALLEAARDAALLVVGNHGETGDSRSLLGSVSQSVMINILSPTVVVKTAERA
ncbi:MAG: universal stress protein [Burkholderiaceae bacterium]|nr:universal stress protein [Microbacteriaceae bacterium]